MDVSIVGTGYVGLVTGTCLAESGNNVICIDNDKEKVESLLKGKVMIYEPGLKEMVNNNIREERLKFTTSIDEALQNSSICFIAVGTPSDESGRADLSFVFDVAREIGRSLREFRIIVTKSTVPVGTTDKVKEIISKETDQDFVVVNNPEFLKEGSALEDFMKPDRVIIGTDSDMAAQVMRNLYKPFLRTEHPIIIMDIRSAELTKYASNALLATRISFINEMANICEILGADINHVRRGMGADSRIGYKFLFPGIGYGGSCFPKDMRALMAIAREGGYEPKVLDSVDGVNNSQRQRFIKKILNHFGGHVKDKTFAIWGLSFKPRTNDIREAPSLTFTEMLLNKGAKIRVYDPAAINVFRGIFGERVVYCHRSYEALEGADALIILTEWNEFRLPNFKVMAKIMKAPLVFDGRNIYEPAVMKKEGFIYYSVGRESP